jgi:hypothetical protein
MLGQQKQQHNGKQQKVKAKKMAAELNAAIWTLLTVVKKCLTSWRIVLLKGLRRRLLMSLVREAGCRFHTIWVDLKFVFKEFSLQI